MSDDRIVMRKIVLEVPQKKALCGDSSRDRMKLMDWIIDTLDDNAWFDDEVAQGTAVNQHLIAMTISPSRGEPHPPCWGYFFPVSNSLEGITSVVKHLQITDRPLQLRMRMTRVDMIHDRAIPLAYRFAAPSARQPSGFPVLVHESSKIIVHRFDL